MGAVDCRSPRSDPVGVGASFPGMVEETVQANKDTSAETQAPLICWPFFWVSLSAVDDKARACIALAGI